MDLTHVHLILNHVPVLGTLFGIFTLAAGMALRSVELKKAGLVVFLVAALITVPVYLTGEPAEETVEGLPGVTKAAIEDHEASAKLSLVAISVLGLLSAGVLLVSRRTTRLAPGLVAATLVVSLATGGLMARTANLGGMVRHSEIRVGNAGRMEGSAPPVQAPRETHEEEHEDH